ncbi:MAG: hypothetical protein ABH950_05875 [Candidatus Altiarchaeota archaeon]
MTSFFWPSLFVLLLVFFSGCIGAEKGASCWDGSKAPTVEECPKFTLPSTISTSSTSTSSTSTPSTSSTSTTSSTSSTSTSTTSTSTTSIPLPTCDDGIQNQNETAIDCGGPCEECEIECRTKEDCSSPHYSIKYCKDNDVYHDWVDYTCLNPNSNKASCRFNKTAEMFEHCLFNKPCQVAYFCEESAGQRNCLTEGRCVRPEDRW